VAYYLKISDTAILEMLQQISVLWKRLYRSEQQDGVSRERNDKNEKVKSTSTTS